jgi:hypothetical protein
MPRILLQLFHEFVDCSHFCNSGSILLSGLLNSESDFILLEFDLDVVDQAFLLISYILLLLNGELVFRLLLDRDDSLISMALDEGNHRLQHIGCFLIVHIFSKIC